MKPDNLLGELCRVLGSKDSGSTPDWIINEQQQLIGSVPINYDSLYEFKFHNLKKRHNSAGLTKPQARDIWASIVYSVFPKLYFVESASEFGDVFEYDLIALRDLIFPVAWIVNYFAYASIPGFGSTSRQFYKDKEKKYATTSLDQKDLKNFEANLNFLIKQIESFDGLPVEIYKATKLMRHGSKVISKAMQSNRQRSVKAQIGLLALNLYTKVPAGKISKAISQDLINAGITPQHKAANLDRATRHFKNELIKQVTVDVGIENPSDLDLLGCIFTWHLEKSGSSKNTFRLKKTSDLFFDDI